MAATRTGVASPERPATPGWPSRRCSRRPACPFDEAEVRAGSPAVVDPAKLRIWIAGHLVYDGSRGGPVEFDRAAARAAMHADEVVFALDLGLGAGSGEGFGCDLTEAYVIENSEYTT